MDDVTNKYIGQDEKETKEWISESDGESSDHLTLDDILEKKIKEKFVVIDKKVYDIKAEQEKFRRGGIIADADAFLKEYR